MQAPSRALFCTQVRIRFPNEMHTRSALAPCPRAARSPRPDWGPRNLPIFSARGCKIRQLFWGQPGTARAKTRGPARQSQARDLPTAPTDQIPRLSLPLGPKAPLPRPSSPREPSLLSRTQGDGADDCTPVHTVSLFLFFSLKHQ